MKIRRRMCLAGAGALLLAGCAAEDDDTSSGTAGEEENQAGTEKEADTAVAAGEDDGDEPEVPRSEAVESMLQLSEKVEFSATPVAIHNAADDRMAIDRMIDLQPPFTLDDLIDFSAFTVTVEMLEGEQREVSSVEELVEVVDTTESSEGKRDTTGVRLNDTEEPFYALKLFNLDKELDGVSFAEGFIAPLNFFSFIPDNAFEHYSDSGLPEALLSALGAPTKAWYRSTDADGTLEEHLCLTYERDDYFIGLFAHLYTEDGGETQIGSTHEFDYGSIKVLDAWVRQYGGRGMEQII